MNTHKLKKLTWVRPFRSPSIVKFLANLIVGLALCTIITQCMALGGLPANSYTDSYTTSWIGNTFSGGSAWVQNHIEGMYVAPDGTVYTNSGWDEGGREAGIYKDGKVVGKADATHGWGRLGGVAVTANSKYLYISMLQGTEGEATPQPAYPPKDVTWYCVRRYFLDGKPAPFPDGHGYDKSMLIISMSNNVTGLATAGSELYVSDNAANQIRVYDTETMAELRSWSFARPQQLAVDNRGNLWIIQAKDAHNTFQILHYSKTGKLLPEKITNIVEPTALAVDSQGRLLVTENGPRQQVLIYKVTGTPKLVDTLGSLGGITSGIRGKVTDLKLYGLTGVGTDSSGNIYVNSNGFANSGTDLRKFSASKALQWRLLGLEFMDNADADPGTDGTDIFTKEEHFVMDYSKSGGKEWTYQAYILDKSRYPDDPRLHLPFTSAVVRRIEGKRFLYLSNMVGSYLAVFRFDGEIAVPCAMFAGEHLFTEKHQSWPSNQPDKGRWIWRDRNGDGAIQGYEYETVPASYRDLGGWDVDSKGNVWEASSRSEIRRFQVRGLDTYGSPIYTVASSAVTPVAKPFTDLCRIRYFPATDVMYITGYTVEHPKAGNEFGTVGTEIVRYDNWSTSKRKVRWRLVLPYEPKNGPLLVGAMDIAGDRIFAATVIHQVQIYVYDATTGTYITKLTPNSGVVDEGWIDIPYGIRAYRRANGHYVVFVEDDTQGKIVMYRLKP